MLNREYLTLNGNEKYKNSSNFLGKRNQRVAVEPRFSDESDFDMESSQPYPNSGKKGNRFSQKAIASHE